jgi:hypothetical protein
MKVPYTKAGKCGNIVYQRARYGQISYPYHVPANPRTPAQTAVRGKFGAVSARWRTLTEAQRQLWCKIGRSKKTRRRLGKQWPMPGFYYFVRVNVFLAHRGLEQVDLPPDCLELASLPVSSRFYIERFAQCASAPTQLHAPGENAGPAPPPSG